MNRNNRVIRALKAAKKAFEQTPPPAPKTVTEKKPFHSECKTAPVTAINVDGLDKSRCTGCSACGNICPVSAIVMKPDKEGFETPFVDSSKCVKCGKCIKYCPASHTVYKNNKRPECYAAYGNNDELRMNSSSGSLFSLAASYIFSIGGKVCGAAYDKDFVLHHIIAENESEMPPLRKSKYVQSNMGTVYSDIGKILQGGKPVLFSGCGCQTAGLYAYLTAEGISDEKLYTVDLMCHGSPSPAVFKKYLDEVHGGAQNIESIDFRSKEYYRWNIDSEMCVTYKDGSLYRRSRFNDPYYRAFISCASVRKSCGTCPFAMLPRQGDITLADFWGVREIDPSYDDGKGTSILIINNEKGADLIAHIKSRLGLCKSVDTDYILTHGQPFGRTFPTHPHHDLYFKYISLGAGVEKAYEYGAHRKFDVAIMGVWYGCNYGSIATYYALHELITGMGLQVLMIDKPLVAKNDPEQGMTHSRRFANEHYEICAKRRLSDLHNLNNNVDTFVIGSDQVWNRGISKSFGMANYFSFADNNKKLISFAASFGHSKDFSNERDRLIISEYMKRFDGISVREEDGVKICREVYGVDAVRVLDPVFVADKSIFEKLTEKSKAKAEHSDEKYILAYILDPTAEKKSALTHLSEKLGLRIIAVPDGAPWNYDVNAGAMRDIAFCPEKVEVEDWLWYIRNCELLVTDSCHGISFAIIFGRQFIGIANKQRGFSRFESLMNVFDLSDRMVTDAREIKNNKTLLKPINYDAVDEIMCVERKRSYEWLKEKLFEKKKIHSLTAFPFESEKTE